MCTRRRIISSRGGSGNGNRLTDGWPRLEADTPSGSVENRGMDSQQQSKPVRRGHLGISQVPPQAPPKVPPKVPRSQRGVLCGSHCAGRSVRSVLCGGTKCHGPCGAEGPAEGPGVPRSLRGRRSCALCRVFFAGCSLRGDEVPRSSWRRGPDDLPGSKLPPKVPRSLRGEVPRYLWRRRSCRRSRALCGAHSAGRSLGGVLCGVEAHTRCRTPPGRQRPVSR